MNRDSFAEHYLKHIAMGEGCNCAESVLRTTWRSTPADPGSGSVLRALADRLAYFCNRSRGQCSKSSD